VFGDPRPASAEKGERLIAAIAAESVRLARIWRTQRGI
jgi:creatinine amidohydrolase